MEAKPSRQPSFTELKFNTFLQTPSFTHQEVNPTDDDVNLECFLLKEDKALSINEIDKKTGMVFGDGIFRLHAFQLSRSHVWSWNLLAENKSHIQVSAANTSNNVQLSGTTVQLPAGVAEQRKEKVEEEEATSDDDVSCTELPLKESGEELRGREKQQESRQKNALNENLWGLRGPAAMPDEMPEEAEETAKEKSIRRRFISWLDDKIHDHCKRKISKTYWREQQEGDEIYRRRIISILFSSALFATGADSDNVYSLCRAQREQQKREMWLRRDKWRQGVQSLLDSYWEGKHEKKEARREKEEERFENWTTEHNISLPDSTAEGSKRRMSLWTKRFLRAKDFFYC